MIKLKKSVNLISLDKFTEKPSGVLVLQSSKSAWHKETGVDARTSGLRRSSDILRHAPGATQKSALKNTVRGELTVGILGMVLTWISFSQARNPPTEEVLVGLVRHTCPISSEQTHSSLHQPVS